MDPRSARTLTFGLVTRIDGGASAELAAFTAALKAISNVSLTCRVWPTYRALASSVPAGDCDVAWLPPVVYAWLAEAVTPLGCIARGGKTTYAATLVTRADSSFREMDDLRNARMGWVDPWSAAGYVVPRIELARLGFGAGAFRSETFFGSHRESLLALMRGDCDAVATYGHPFATAALPKEGAWSEVENLEVRVIASVGEIPADVIAVRRNLEPEAYRCVLEALQKASMEPKVQPLLQAVFGGYEFHEGIGPGHHALRQAFERSTANGLFD